MCMLPPMWSVCVQLVPVVIYISFKCMCLSDMLQPQMQGSFYLELILKAYTFRFILGQEDLRVKQDKAKCDDTGKCLESLEEMEKLILILFLSLQLIRLKLYHK